MGCGSSVPVAESNGDDHVAGKKAQTEDKKGAAPPASATTQPHENGKAAPKAGEAAGGATEAEAKAQASKNTRARRLSYITADTNGVMVQPPLGVPPNEKPTTPPATAAAAPAAAGPTAGPGTPLSGPGSTRARRLSYITNDPNGIKVPAVGDVVEGEEGEEGAEEDDGAPADMLAAAAPQDNPVESKRTIRVAVACMSRAGREPGFKKTNQDNCFAFEKYITEDQSLFGAMDGHGPHGHLVSGYVKQHLPIMLVNHLTVNPDPKKALHQGFTEVDKSLSKSRIDCEFSGSTAVVSYLKGNTLTTAWVGDSRGVLGREGKKGVVEAVDLTYDHKPTNADEKARILRSNGRVERLVDEMGQPMGPYRVWLQYAWIPGLAMSRALGDFLAHQVGVTSEPDHTTMELTPQDRFIILASDGVWEFISSKDAVDIVAQYDSAEEACRQLVDEAYQRWLMEEEGVVDDITAVVVRFIHPGQ